MLLIVLLACNPDPKPIDTAADGGTSTSDGGTIGTTDGGGDAGGDGGGSDGGSDGGGHGGVDGGSDGGADGGSDGGTTATPLTPAVILFIGDGMGFPHLEGGSLRATGSTEGLVMHSAPYQGSMTTASMTGLTDSAAAATAMASGQKTWNNVLGLDRDLVPVESLLRLAQSRGLATGIVTSDSLTGATPAAWYSHTDNRGDTDTIIADLLADPPDVAIGGGRSELGTMVDPTVFQLVTDAAALESAVADGRPLMALLSEHSFEYRVDNPDAQPTLAELVELALDRLEGDPEGFFLVVEGARIDHASHAMRSEAVHLETMDFDLAVSAAVERSGSWVDRDLAILVGADHECGGLQIETAGTKGEDPEVSWRWGDHTNAHVPLLGWGDRLADIDGELLDNLWVHALLRAPIAGEELVEPTVPRLLDGRLEDLGDRVVTQTIETDFGAGYNQLDAIRVSTDSDGLWVGLDGVYDDESNALLVWVDLDLGEGTGVGADLVLVDSDGELDDLLSRVGFRHEIVELGFDAAVGQIAGTYVHRGRLLEEGGLRVFSADHGDPDDIWWMDSAINFGDGSLALGGPATAAAATGTTEGGAELLLPWTSLFPDGMPSDGTTLAVFAQLVNTDATLASNQALPPLSSSDAPLITDVPILQVVRVEVDGAGETLTPARLWP